MSDFGGAPVVSMTTGLYSHQTGCLFTGEGPTESTLAPRFPTWGTMLRELGYRTWWWGKWHLGHAGDTTPDGLDAHGFAGGTYPSPNGAPNQGLQKDPSIVDQFTEWFDTNADSGPWCTTVSLVNPHHGTVYFGVNNYRAGFSAGVALAEHAIRHWRSEVGALLLLESPLAGRTVQSRLVGAVRGIQERLGPLPEKAIHHLDGGGDKATSKAVVTSFLKSRSQKNILIVGINDESAIGAVQAADQTKAGAEVAIVGHGGSTEIMKLIVDPKSPCIGTISVHAELYGADLLHFALPLAQGKSAPAAHYVPHEFLGREALTRERGGEKLLRRSS